MGIWHHSTAFNIKLVPLAYIFMLCNNLYTKVIWRLNVTLIVVLSLFTIKSTVVAQTISGGFGPVFTHSNQRIKMVNSREDFMNTAYQWSVSYEHAFKRFERLSLITSASSFEGVTFIIFEEGSVDGGFGGGYLLGVGFSGVDIVRIDFQLARDLFSLHRRIYLRPMIGIGLQVSKSQNIMFYNIADIQGPDYFQIADITTEAFNTVQFVPVAGLKTGVLLWRRIELGVSIQGVVGFRSYQDLYFPYSYRGEVQETAVFESKGTGIFATLNLGYRLVKRKGQR